MKNKIYRVNRDESLLNFVIRFPKGKTFADIVDVVFLIKTKNSDPLVASLVLKLYNSSEIIITSPDIVQVKFATSDYDSLDIDVLYEAALFCKWDGNNDFDENVERLFDFQVTQNFHNDN